MAHLDLLYCIARKAAREWVGRSAGEGKGLAWDYQLDSEIVRMTILQSCRPRDGTEGLIVVVGLPKKYCL